MATFEEEMAQWGEQFRRPESFEEEAGIERSFQVVTEQVTLDADPFEPAGRTTIRPRGGEPQSIKVYCRGTSGGVNKCGYQPFDIHFDAGSGYYIAATTYFPCTGGVVYDVSACAEVKWYKTKTISCCDGVDETSVTIDPTSGDPCDGTFGVPIVPNPVCTPIPEGSEFGTEIKSVVSNEYTDEELYINAVASVPDYSGDFTLGAWSTGGHSDIDSSSIHQCLGSFFRPVACFWPDYTGPTDSISLTKFQYYFVLRGVTGASPMLNWIERTFDQQNPDTIWTDAVFSIAVPTGNSTTVTFESDFPVSPGTTYLWDVALS